jgi:hypothetical protein
MRSVSQLCGLTRSIMPSYFEVMASEQGREAATVFRTGKVREQLF